MNANKKRFIAAVVIFSILILARVNITVRTPKVDANVNSKNETVLVSPPTNTITFFDRNRYFPSFIIQKGRISFLWDNFTTLRKDVWGTGIDGKVSHKDIETQTNKLVLKSGQMIWLLHRLGYGMVEFRWSAFGKPTKGMDQMMGFGDPGEAFFVGFRLVWPESEPSPKLEAQAINFGQANMVPIPWQERFEKQERFFIIRKKGMTTFIAGSTVLAHITDSGTVDFVPEIGLEIMAANRSGPPMRFQVIKFDAFADMM